MTTMYGYRLKRPFDVLVTLLLLPFAAPLCLLLLVLIRIESPGNPLFRQRRVGRNGRTFPLLKLRTMHRDTGNLPSHEVGRSQITRIGHLLRRTKLDELPQLLNILVGHMSFVGPRPCLPSQVELIEARASRGALIIRPGLTGRAQVEGVDMSQPQLLAQRDELYLLEMSLGVDISYLIRTFIGGGRGDAVQL